MAYDIFLNDICSYLYTGKIDMLVVDKLFLFMLSKKYIHFFYLNIDRLILLNSIFYIENISSSKLKKLTFPLFVN